MKVLVTGATGFIGQNLVKSLLKEGYEVRALVRNPTKLQIIDPMLDVVNGDITKKETLDSCCKDIDVVYHTAGQLGGVGVSLSKLMNVNVDGTRNMIECSIEEGVKKFVHVSSVAAMGDSPLNADETYECKPVTDYDISKYESEVVVKQYEDKIAVVILRPTMVYGPGEVTNKAKLYRFVKKGYFKIIGEGKGFMSWLYIDNFIYACMLVMGDNVKAETYIISDERPYTLMEYTYALADELKVKRPGKIPLNLARTVAKILEFGNKNFGSPAPLTTDRISTLIASRSFDISKAKNELGYNPQINLKEGIKNTVEWYKKEKILA
jgi:nucleoside-diphosphate-sugar epimerase